MSTLLANLPLIGKILFTFLDWWMKYQNKSLEMAESYERFKLASHKKGAMKVKNFKESEDLLLELQAKIKKERLEREKAN